MDPPYVRFKRRPGQPHGKHRLVAAALVTGMSLPALVACTTDTRGSAGSADGRTITVTSTDNSCDLSANTAPAGNLVFKVTNSGSTVTAFFLYDPDRQRNVGGVENLAPGLSRDLVMNLPAGSYVRTCEPDLVVDDSSGKFTVTGSQEPTVASGPSQEQVDTATSQYKAYVANQAAQLLAGTREFVRAFVAGDDVEARRRYTTTRAPLRRIQPVLESFEKLDLRMDGRAADLDPGRKWTGWHRIEKELWPPSGQPAEALNRGQRAVLGRQLLRDTRTLDAGVRVVAFTADQIGEGASRLLEEVAIETVTGKEEVWSHSDLDDLQADIDGARAAFDALRPVLTVTDRSLERRIARRFGELEARLGRYRVGVDGFARYDTLTVNQVRQLSDAVNALAEPLSLMAAAVAL
jgi:iron uptake system component EfeO